MKLKKNEKEIIIQEKNENTKNLNKNTQILNPKLIPTKKIKTVKNVTEIKKAWINVLQQLRTSKAPMKTMKDCVSMFNQTVENSKNSNEMKKLITMTDYSDSYVSKITEEAESSFIDINKESSNTNFENFKLIQASEVEQIDILKYHSRHELKKNFSVEQLNHYLISKGVIHTTNYSQKKLIDIIFETFQDKQPTPTK